MLMRQLLCLHLVSKKCHGGMMSRHRCLFSRLPGFMHLSCSEHLFQSREDWESGITGLQVNGEKCFGMISKQPQSIK